MRTFVIVLLFSLLGGGQAQGLLLRPEEKIVFLGDRVTARGQFTVYAEAYLRTRFPTNSYHLINAARSGETVSALTETLSPGRLPQVHQRFSQEVAALQPTMVVTCYGMEDAAYAPFADEYFARFILGYEALVKLIRNQTPARWMIMTPPNFDPVPAVSGPDRRPWETYTRQRPFAHYDRALQAYGEYLIQEYQSRAMIADVHSRMKRHLAARRQTDPAFRLQDDGIHPNSTGQMIMALALLEAWQAPPFRDQVEVDALSPPRKGGAVSGFSKEDQEITFQWKTRLPMPVDPLWDDKSVALENMDSRFYQLRLRVTNLAPATYQLQIDKRKAGEFTAGELRGGIDLAQLEDFSLRAKSLRVLSLIRRQHALGLSAWTNLDSPEKEQWEELEREIKDLCQPAEMEVRITALAEDKSEKDSSTSPDQEADPQK